MKPILLNLFLVFALTITFFVLVFNYVNPLILFLYVFFFLSYLLLILSAIWPKDSPWAPWWRTDKKTAEAILKFTPIKKGDVVYDLGSGDGEVLIAAGKIGAKGIGIEIDPLRVLISKYRAKTNSVSHNIKFERGDFFEKDLRDANIIIVYLIPKTLNRLIPKFKKELKKGTKIVSYRYEMNLKPAKVDKKNMLYLYEI